MPLTPALNARVTITVRDINNNNVAKVFNMVNSISFDYVKGMVKIIDAQQGQFDFTLMTITTLTYTVVAGVNGQTSIVMS